MVLGIDHLGIAVCSLDNAITIYCDLLGFELEHVEEVITQKVKVAKLRAGDSTIELLQPMTEECALGKFLEKRGEGLHHIALQVDDIEAELSLMAEKGARLVNRTPVAGADGMLVAFVHPASTGKVLIELCQHPGETD